MSAETYERLCRRIFQHCTTHNKQNISLTFHGGEPLLGGATHLARLFDITKRVLIDAGISVRLGMQSNGLLFSTEIGDLMLENRAGIGISIDGPPRINDIFRVDHLGVGSSAVLEKKLKLLVSPKYRNLLTGFLIVVNLAASPRETLDYLFQFAPPEIDFLLPYDNWDRRPPGKENFESTLYADWLIDAFEYWYSCNSRTRIRQFASIMRLILGGSSLVESVGLDPITLVVIETNGDIEALDSLKGTFNGATALGLNIVDHDLEIAASHISVQSRQMGANALCTTCQECPVVHVCGGGYLPNRYSLKSGFDNPSIYCRDLEKLIRHIHSRVSKDVSSPTMKVYA